ncbi:hypothetical protein [Streptomyces sp. NPDC059513]|uniref:hypothetical protein n=1 Tax=unclassified Streptomyces TaxID=2593676 RepID=UPI003676A7C2
MMTPANRLRELPATPALPVLRVTAVAAARTRQAKVRTAAWLTLRRGLARTGARDRTQAVIAAYESGLITPG